MGNGYGHPQRLYPLRRRDTRFGDFAFPGICVRSPLQPAAGYGRALSAAGAVPSPGLLHHLCGSRGGKAPLAHLPCRPGTGPPLLPPRPSTWAISTSPMCWAPGLWESIRCSLTAGAGTPRLMTVLKSPAYPSWTPLSPTAQLYCHQVAADQDHGQEAGLRRKPPLLALAGLPTPADSEAFPEIPGAAPASG